MLRDARKRVSSNDDADWQWLTEALADPSRKNFVADVFRFQPVPKRLFAAFVRAAVLDVNYSNNRWFLTPFRRQKVGVGPATNPSGTGRGRNEMRPR